MANQVLMMDEYVLKYVTRKAKAIASEDSHSKDEASLSQFGQTSQRIPLKSSFSNKGKDRLFKVKGMHTILYGKERINISGLEQLVDASQTNCIAIMIDYYQSNLLNEQDTISQAADKIFDLISEKGLDIVSPHQGHPGNLALPRKQEFCGALNRYRGLNIKTH